MKRLDWHWSNATQFLSSTLAGLACYALGGYLAWRHVENDGDWPTGLIVVLALLAVVGAWMLGRRGLAAELLSLRDVLLGKSPGRP